MSSTTRMEILNILEERGTLNNLGYITLLNTFHDIFDKQFDYNTFRTHFPGIMNTMVEQGKAIKSKGAAWIIIIPNER